MVLASFSTVARTSGEVFSARTISKRRITLAGEKKCRPINCAGRWLACDILAQRAQPWADLSAMDGYAVRAAEAIELTLIEEEAHHARRLAETLYTQLIAADAA